MTRQTHRNYQIYKWVCVCVDTFVRPLATLIRLKIAACVDKDRVLSRNGCLELLAGNASQIYTMHVCVSVMFVRIQFNSIALRWGKRLRQVGGAGDGDTNFAIRCCYFRRQCSNDKRSNHNRNNNKNNKQSISNNNSEWVKNIGGNARARWQKRRWRTRTCNVQCPLAERMWGVLADCCNNGLLIIIYCLALTSIVIAVCYGYD